MVRADGSHGSRVGSRHGRLAMSAMSLRQFARVLGVSDTAVRKAERRGVFGDTVRRDAAGQPGVVDVAAAIAAWERAGGRLRGSRVERQDAPALLPEARVASVPADEAHALLDDAIALPGDAEDGDDAPTPPVAPASTSLVEATRMAMLERHRRLKLENDTREGSLIPVERATAAAFEFARVLRENVLNVPGRIGAELAGESDAGRVHVILEAALREALETTANTLDAPLATPPPPTA